MCCFNDNREQYSNYYRYRNGEKPSSNPVATIFAWSGAFRQRGIFDETRDLVDYADALESACVETITDGIMTGDLALLVSGEVKTVNSEDFLDEVRSRLQNKLRV